MKVNAESLFDENPELCHIRKAFMSAVDLLCDRFEHGGKLLIAGNGGSMSDALHISGELLKSFQIERKGFFTTSYGLQPGVPVWVLGINPSLYSAVGNDLAERGVEFAQELYAVGRPEDVFLAISTSGKAENVCIACEVAKMLGMQTISLTGQPGATLADLADIPIRAPGTSTATIQEFHLKIYHALCAGIEEKLFGQGGKLTGLFGTQYNTFDVARIGTYSIYRRENRTEVDTLVLPKGLTGKPSKDSEIAFLAQETYRCWKSGYPVIIMTGAHLIKNGLSPLLIDLVKRKIPHLVAVNGACPIHDTELALCGGTSEKVVEALPRGEFGFADETAQIVNTAYREAHKRRMGAGETLGALLSGDVAFNPEYTFPFREYSLFYNAYKEAIPVTIHAGIGTEIVDQHPNACFEAKGYACGLDFSIFSQMMTTLVEGGVVINIGDAVTHPEVLLKSVSMAANIGKSPRGIVTAVFDLFDIDLNDINDEEQPGYYRRDIKSIVVRIPQAFGGRGIYIRGNQKETFVEFYLHLRYLLEHAESFEEGPDEGSADRLANRLADQDSGGWKGGKA